MHRPIMSKLKINLCIFFYLKVNYGEVLKYYKRNIMKDTQINLNEQ